MKWIFNLKSQSQLKPSPERETLRRWLPRLQQSDLVHVVETAAELGLVVTPAGNTYAFLIYTFLLKNFSILDLTWAASAEPMTANRRSPMVTIRRLTTNWKHHRIGAHPNKMLTNARELNIYSDKKTATCRWTWVHTFTLIKKSHTSRGLNSTYVNLIISALGTCQSKASEKQTTHFGLSSKM